MKYSGLFLLWLILFMGIFVMMMFINDGPDIRSELPRVYIVIDDVQAVVESKDDFRLRYFEYEEQGKSIATVVYEPEIHTGPIGGVIDFYSTESIFPSSSNILPWDDQLTESEMVRAYEALLKYTNNDPLMVQYRPGKPAQTRFVPTLLLATALRLILLISFPTICVYFTWRFWKPINKSAA